MISNNFFVSIKQKKLFLKQLLFLLLIISLIIVFLTFTTHFNVKKYIEKRFLNGIGMYTEEVSHIEFQSDNYDDRGSWHVDKSAKWIGSGKAEITFDVSSILKSEERYKDIILVIDVSGSMRGSKLNRVISDSKALATSLLSDTNNKMSIITFGTSSSVVSDFTNDKNSIFEILDNISINGCTNYYAALKKVDLIMSNYQFENDRDVAVLFLTDGYPNKGSPNQVGFYDYLKDKYPSLTIDGIQYELGVELIDEIKEISDNQWIADQTNLREVLFSAALNPILYDKFILTDYIDNQYFTIQSIDDISVSKGEFSLEEENGVPKVIWDLGDNSFMTGGKAEMKIKLLLKDEYVDKEGFYPTNKSENVNYKIESGDEKIVQSLDTPVLKNKYEVKYDVNTPDGCNIEEFESEKYFVYENVVKKNISLSCDNYLFKGWEIEDNSAEDIQKINDDVFVMPNHDVVIRATWSRQSINKTMDGTVHEKTTLYKVLENEANIGTYARKYNGSHQDSIDSSLSTKNIYYYYGSNNTNGRAILDKNNVIFAGQCWQMIRTTDTGGVKMIYNGETVDGKCLSTRGTHVGYVNRTTSTLSSNYWYGTSYVYDSLNKTFTLAGDLEQVKWTSSIGNRLNGKYTCRLTSADGSCKTLYLVESYNNSTSANVLPINSNAGYSVIGFLPFSAGRGSLAYAGYMYGDIYGYNTISSTNTVTLTATQTLLTSGTYQTDYWYADDVEYDSISGKYSLIDPYQVSSEDYSNLVGTYTFKKTDESYTANSVYYIAGNDTTMYAKQLSNGEGINSIILGDSIIKNEDGTYSLDDIQTVTYQEWVSNYSNYQNKFICDDNTNTCEIPRYITTNTVTGYTYVNVLEDDKIMIAKSRNGLELVDTLLISKSDLFIHSTDYSDYKYSCGNTDSVCTESSLRMIQVIGKTGYAYIPNHYYGSSVSWNGNGYDLEDVSGLETATNLNELSTHHYMCLGVGASSCTSVAYITYYTGSGSMYYIVLNNENVTSVSDAIRDMFQKNTNSSVIKVGIDAWYKRYLNDYSIYIEDTIFCNDRTVINYGGFKDDGGGINEHLFFKERNISNSLSCANETDQFSISNEKAKLTYPIALMSSPEMHLLNNNEIRKSSNFYYVLSPTYYYHLGVRGRGIAADGSDNNDGRYVIDEHGVRPAISLIPGIEYSSGDGSAENPYIVETY